MKRTLLFLTCPSRVVTPLVEELTTLLEAEQSAARVMKYGILLKGSDGFLLLAAPSSESYSTQLLAHLKQDDEISGYVEVHENEMAFLQPDEAIWHKEASTEEASLPCVPSGYTLKASPLPLISPADGRWIARAAYDESGDEGILLYEDALAIAFLTADEVAMSLAYFMKEAWTLLPEMDVTLSPLHAQAVDHLRSQWWQEETRKVRALINESQEEVQG